MNATALRKIENDLSALAKELEAGETIAPFDLHVIARKIGAQAEMAEIGLTGEPA